MNEKYKSLLSEFIKFKSISTDPEFKDDIKETVEWLKNLFEKYDFQVEIIEGYGNPLVIASYKKNENLETALIYGHYDVQPAQKDEGWDSEPFELEEREGRIFARGAIDNKGQVMVHIATVLDLIEKGELNYNIKFIMEGDEETGSENIEDFFKDHANKLKADFAVISDGELMMGHPMIEIGFRGIFNCTLTVTTSEKDNHSGTYGGSIPNAANELVKVLSKMHNDMGELTIDGVDNNYTLPTEILENNSKLPFDLEIFKNTTGAEVILREDELNYSTLTGYLTSAEITTLSSGYMGEGYRNAIPGRALAKINFRLAANTSVETATSSFKKFLEVNMPKYLKWELIIDQANEPIKIDYKNEYISMVKTILEEVYQKEVFFFSHGAIVPICGLFQDYLKIPLLVVPLGNEDCNMHGANENYKIEDINKALEFSRRLLQS